MSLLFRLLIGLPTVTGFGFMRIATPSPCIVTVSQERKYTYVTSNLRHSVDEEIGKGGVSEDRGRRG
jgi:hypothetical protein